MNAIHLHADREIIAVPRQTLKGMILLIFYKPAIPTKFIRLYPLSPAFASEHAAFGGGTQAEVNYSIVWARTSDPPFPRVARCGRQRGSRNIAPRIKIGCIAPNTALH
jgi:hypothetical protein